MLNLRLWLEVFQMDSSLRCQQQNILEYQKSSNKEFSSLQLSGQSISRLDNLKISQIEKVSSHVFTFLSFDWLLFIWFFIFFTIFSYSSQFFKKLFCSSTFCVYFTNWSDCEGGTNFFLVIITIFFCDFSVRENEHEKCQTSAPQIRCRQKVNKKNDFTNLARVVRYLSNFTHKFCSSGGVTLSLASFIRLVFVAGWLDTSESHEIMKKWKLWKRKFHFLFWFFRKFMWHWFIYFWLHLIHWRELKILWRTFFAAWVNRMRDDKVKIFLISKFSSDWNDVD